MANEGILFYMCIVPYPYTVNGCVDEGMTVTKSSHSGFICNLYNFKRWQN